MLPATARPSSFPARPPREHLPTNTPLDRAFQCFPTVGFPRGAISEITGPDCSGRTAIAYSTLAASTNRLEICAYVDTCDSFDPASAAAAGIALDRLIWVRCGGHPGNAMKAADNLLHAGGFGVVVLDLCSVPQPICRRIPISYWHRFRLTLENSPTILLIAGREPLAKPATALVLEMKRNRAIWTGAPGFHLLGGMEVQADRKKPVASQGGSCALRMTV